jgi:hypothetical protein
MPDAPTSPTMTTEDIRRDQNTPDQIATADGEQVGRFKMAVVRGEMTSESEEKWATRSDALARWLVAEWHREQDERRST